MNELEKEQNFLPEPPEKKQIVKMLNKIHAPGVQNWTIKEQQEMYIALRAFAFFYFRTEDILTDI